MKSSETIDLTPSWSGVLPLLLELVKNPRTYNDAVTELERMAQIADAYVNKNK